MTEIRVRLIVAILALGFCASPTYAQYDPGAAQTHLRAAGQAYRDGDYAGFASELETAHELNPFSLATTYNLACAYARTGRPDDAFALLDSLVASRVDYGMANDPDLESLHDDARFPELLRQLEINMRPVSTSKHEFTVDQLGIIPEGIAIDTATSRTFFGSMRNGDIFVRDAEGRLSKFATVEHGGTMAAIGLYIDQSSQTLWAIGTTFFLNEQFDPEAPGRAGVFGFDLASGALKKKYISADPEAGFNDVTMSPSGDLYLSGDQLSIVRAGSDAIEALEISTRVFGSNGVAVSPDGSKLFATSYPVGIAVIDTDSGDTRWIEPPKDTTLYGIDGLYWHEGDLVGVQNGARPWRLVRLELNDTQDAIVDVHLVEFANAAVTPTTGAIVGDTIYYVGEGPDPENIPGHFPPQMAGNSGKTIVMSAPLH